MHMDNGVCSPEQLHRLQSIFDEVWKEVRTDGGQSFTGAHDAETLRTEIARQVISHADSDLSRAEITRAVLKSLGNCAGLLRS
jgi:hypothetical protein